MRQKHIQNSVNHRIYDGALVKKPFWFSDIFSGYRKRLVAWNRLIQQKSPGGVLCKRCYSRNFAKFIVKHLCQSLLFNRLKLATLSKKRLLSRCSPVNFAKFVRTTFLYSKIISTPFKTAYVGVRRPSVL